MGLIAIIGSIISASSEAIGTAGELRTIYNSIAPGKNYDQHFTHCAKNAFNSTKPHIFPLCKDGPPDFLEAEFLREIEGLDFSASTIADLKAKTLPILERCVTTPGAICNPERFKPTYELIIDLALDAFWKEIAADAHLSLQMMLRKDEAARAQQTRILEEVGDVHQKLKNLEAFFQAQWTPEYKFTKQPNLPKEYQIQNRKLQNPFHQSKAEDFNHNFAKLARIFHTSPDWDAITRRTDNVIIAGGRGTGKSMLLRRMTAQATIEAARQINPDVSFEQLDIEYFGIYVKLARGYYDQFDNIPNQQKPASNLLAQHELNVEIFDSFCATLAWLEAKSALPKIAPNAHALVRELNLLFPGSPKVDSFSELSTIVVRHEQDALNTLISDSSLNKDTENTIKPKQTVYFCRRLSEIFRARLFPERELRMFILLDEYEALLKVQQVAINTLIKMRLPDLSVKIGVRLGGVRTSDTFNNGDPVQYPRDYIPINLDYDIESQGYRDLLRGISEKRLKEAGYSDTNIEHYLLEEGVNIDKAVIENELDELWRNGRRKAEARTTDFDEKYQLTAIYRAFIKRRSTVPISGFSQFAMLSSGVVSTFIELCKYAFFHALEYKVDLVVNSRIPGALQARAIYEVSHRHVKMIEGNVPNVGITLRTLVTDLGAILRSRLLSHTSETECNRISIIGYDLLNPKEDSGLIRIINDGVTWSVFHVIGESEAHKPKSSVRPPSMEITLSRTFAPALEITPRTRWRVEISAHDLSELCDPLKRKNAFARLMHSVGCVTPEKQSDLQLPFLN